MSFLIGFAGGVVVGVAASALFLLWYSYKHEFISITKPK
jgi:MFS superfamily sulfate permease-like transporter